MLITLVITLVVLALVYWLVSLLPLPDPFGLIVKVLFVLIAVLYILNAYGVVHTGNLV